MQLFECLNNSLTNKIWIFQNTVLVRYIPIESSQLRPEQSYLLYCDKGLMSRIQAQLMREKGFIKVGIFKPKL
jgi:thiamine biosynthesis protein ThiI